MVAPINNNGTGGIVFGGSQNNNGVEENKENKTPEVKQPEVKQVNPDDVFAYLANNGVYVPVVTDVNSDGAIDKLDVDPAMEARIDEFMANFDVVYRLIEEEFGSELAPLLVNMVMDRVMGF